MVQNSMSEKTYLNDRPSRQAVYCATAFTRPAVYSVSFGKARLKFS